MDVEIFGQRYGRPLFLIGFYLRNKLKDMLTDINPKLPMRDKAITTEFYISKLGFQQYGSADYDGYLMVQRDSIQIHFFEFKDLDPHENYGQVYIRTDEIDKLYESALDKELRMPAAGHLQTKPWRQKEFSLLDPDNNLLTFGESL
jgi:glyoxalase/bleomycin resistance protein/dioxygenase superfamily protein